MMRWFGRRRARGFVLALGGGGGRGLAHLGVLAELEASGLRPSAIVGTSIGALFGAMYALDPDGEVCIARAHEGLESDLFNSLELPVLEGEEVDDESWLSRLAGAARQSILFARAATGVAVSDVGSLIRIVHDFCQERTFDDLAIPLHVTAVTFPAGECRMFSGDSDVPLARAVAASMAIPGVFAPVEIRGERFVDGGLASELPAREARMVAGPDEFVVAVNVGARPSPDDEPKNVMAMIDWATRIKALYLRRYEKQCADVLIEPLVGFKQWHDFSHPDKEIEKGREAARKALPELRDRLGR